MRKKMSKRLATALAIIILTIATDLVLQTAVGYAGENFNLQLSQLIFFLKPVILVMWYVILLITTCWLATDDNFPSTLAILFVALGLLIIFAIRFSSSINDVLPASLYRGIVSLSSSPVELTFHAGAYLIATGGVRLLWRQKRKKNTS